MSFARESKTFYNSNGNVTMGAPGTRIRHPFDPRAGIQRGAQQHSAVSLHNGHNANGLEPGNMNRRGGYQPSSSYHATAGRHLKRSKSQMITARSSHSSDSVSPSSSKTQFEQRVETASTVSLASYNHQQRSYRNRARYMTANVGMELVGQHRGQQPAGNYQPPLRRMPKFTEMQRQHTRSYHSRHMEHAGYSVGIAHYQEAHVELEDQDSPGITAASSGTSDGDHHHESDFEQRSPVEYAAAVNAEFSSDADPQGNSQPSRTNCGDCDSQSYASMEPSSSSDSTESEQSDASLESMVRKITISCLALATSAQMPDLKGPNLIPFGNMHHLRESERKGQHGMRNGFKCSSHCCGDMLVEPKTQLVRPNEADEDNCSEASALSCNASARSSKTVLAVSTKGNIIKVGILFVFRLIPFLGI